MKGEEILFFIFMLIIAVVVTSVISFESGCESMEREAVEAGVAAYEVVDSSGSVEFRFLTKEELCK